MFIYCSGRSSRGAVALAQALKRKEVNTSKICVTKESTKYVDKAANRVVNWGRGSTFAGLTKSVIWNDPRAVKTSLDRETFFVMLKRSKIPTLEFGDLDAAMKWVRDGIPVVGHHENFCAFPDDPMAFAEALFYTKYIKKKYEFRIHVAFGEVIYEEIKALRQLDESGRPLNPKFVDKRIRSVENGFFYDEYEGAPVEVHDLAKKTIEALGLDFGGVKVIYNETKREATVINVSLTPKLSNPLADAYVSAFLQKENT